MTLDTFLLMLLTLLIGCMSLIILHRREEE